MARHPNQPPAPVNPATPEALDYLPRGWQSAILDLGGQGKGHGSFIRALGIAPQDFYALATNNKEFALALANADAARMAWVENRLVAIADGLADPRGIRAVEIIFNAFLRDFAARYSPAKNGDFDASTWTLDEINKELARRTGLRLGELEL